MKLKKMLSLLAAAAMAVTALTVSMSMSVVNAADSYVTSGKIGENASWVINTDGVLVVSGTGDIARPSDGWRWNGHDIDEVVIEDGITSVTASANQQLVSGSGCANIYKITMPPSFKKLSGCIDNLSTISGLTDIYIYSTNITDTAYQSNEYPGGITWHVYKDSETDKSLRNDLGLTDEDIEYIPDNEKMPTVDKTPAQVEPLTETSGPAGLTSKWEWNESSKTLTFSGKGAISMFNDFKNYAEITEHIIINSGITRIGKVTRKSAYASSGAFEGFTAFKDVQLPDTLVQIGDKSFSKLPLEGELSLPSSLKKIGMYAFEETNITSINSLKPGMTIGAFAFQKCNLLTEITIPQNIVYGSTGSPNGNGSSCSPFNSCSGLEKVVIEGGGSMSNMGGGLHAAENAIPYALCPNCTSLKIVIIKGNVEYIAQEAFKGCTSLTDMYLYNTDLNKITAKGTVSGMNFYKDSFDTTNNPTFHVIKGSTTEQTLRDAGYLTDENTQYLPDTSALEAAITEAEEIDTSKYTDETVAALTTAVENGKALLENIDATQEAVDQAVTAVKDAISALKEKVEEPTDEPPTDEPTEPTEPETQEPTTEPADVTVSVTPDKAYAMPGDEVTYTIHVDTKKVPLYTVQMRLVIPEGMTYVENSGSIVDGVQAKLGYDNVAWTEQSLIINGYASAPNAVDSFDLATFKCKVDEGVADATELAMDLTYLEFTEEGFAKIANVAVAAGVVTVGEDPNPTEPSTEPTSDDTTQAPTNGGSTTTPTDKPAGNNNNNNNNGSNNNNNGGANGTGTSATDKPVNTGAPAAVGLSAFLAAAAIGLVAMKKRNR